VKQVQGGGVIHFKIVHRKTALDVLDKIEEYKHEHHGPNKRVSLEEGSHAMASHPMTARLFSSEASSREYLLFSV
jgi:hypothetical protein